MWILPLYLHVNQKSDDEDDAFVWEKVEIIVWKLLLPVNFNYVPHQRGVGGHIVFSADPVSLASCLHSISLVNGWILAKHTFNIGWGKMWIRF